MSEDDLNKVLTSLISEAPETLHTHTRLQSISTGISISTLDSTGPKLISWCAALPVVPLSIRGTAMHLPNLKICQPHKLLSLFSLLLFNWPSSPIHMAHLFPFSPLLLPLVRASHFPTLGLPHWVPAALSWAIWSSRCSSNMPSTPTPQDGGLVLSSWNALPQVSARLAPSLLSVLDSNVSFSEMPFLLSLHNVSVNYFTFYS